MTALSAAPDARLKLIQNWLQSILPAVFAAENWGNVPTGQLAVASSDASFRRYFRWQGGEKSLIIMDAPPTQEDCRPFMSKAKQLAQAGLHVPRIFAADVQAGFLLLEDLGKQTYLDILNQKSPSSLNEEPVQQLFTEAIDALVLIQRCALTDGLPFYDRSLLEYELQLFPEWYLGRHFNIVLTTTQQALWQCCCNLLVDNALSQPKVWVHRDFMVRNLMCSHPNPGILDFQDAVCGPVSYDPICLFKDAFISWKSNEVDHGLYQYWQQAKESGINVSESFTHFLRDCDLMGVQRHLKVIGIAARLAYRDGKPKLLGDVPRFFQYLNEVIERRPELSVLAEFLESTTGIIKDQTRPANRHLFDQPKHERYWQRQGWSNMLAAVCP